MDPYQPYTSIFALVVFGWIVYHIYDGYIRPHLYLPNGWDTTINIARINSERKLNDHAQRLQQEAVSREPDPTPISEPIHESKPKPQPKTKQTVSTVDHPLYSDCTSALINIGYKKTDAHLIFRDMLKTEKFETPEDFLQIVFSKGPV